MSSAAVGSQLDRIIASCLVYLSVERNLSPRTLEAYRGDYRSFAASLGAGDAWRNDAKAAQEWLADANVAVATKRRRAAALRVLYRFAEGEGELTRSLSGEIDLPRTRRNLPAVLRPDEVERLLVALAAPRVDQFAAYKHAPWAAGQFPQALPIALERVSLLHGVCLFRNDVGVLGDPAVLHQVGLNHLGEALRRAAGGIQPLRRKLLAHARVPQYLVDLLSQAVNDCFGRAGRRQEAIPDVDFVPGKRHGFGNSRYLGQ